MRCAVDTGGTFTDLVIEDDAGELRIFKASTVPSDPVKGVLDAVDKAAEGMGLQTGELLGRMSLFLHGTTRALNAILTGNTAKTALLVTEGHRDILVFREGGRADPFDNTIDYPQPYIPRALTFAVRERIGSGGDILVELDEEAAVATIGELAERGVEAVAVCLLWATVEPRHELRVGELLEEHLPGVPYTLSHQVNPILREYRRASSTAIDASLKPLMTTYLGGLSERLQEAGFGGRLLMVTSNGGLLEVDHVAQAPIHSLNSGPAMAPVAGRHYARLDADAETAIVADTGGTSYDISVVRGGRIPRTQETWIGPVYRGHLVGFPSIDVKSIGAGGGSIAGVDAGGLLYVGPESAGADPGPVCYGRGGTRPTVTDASLVLGLLDADYFLGGTMQLDVEAARAAIAEHVADPIGLSVEEAAAAVLQLATERMARAIEDVTINQGIDPRDAVLIGGGGAAGLNAAGIARRLGARQLIIPEVAAALSAAGALLSELRSEYAATFATVTSNFDHDGVAKVIAGLRERCEEFLRETGADPAAATIEFAATARYPFQNWELELPLRSGDLADREAVENLREDFHALHEELFAINEPDAHVEIVGWRARVSASVGDGELRRLKAIDSDQPERTTREVYFAGSGATETAVVLFDAMEIGERIEGPAIVESPVTTVVVEPGGSVERRDSGSLVITPAGGTGVAEMVAAREEAA